MKKPSLPTKPKEPKAPTKVYQTTYEENAYLNGTLAELIATIARESTGTPPGWAAGQRKLGPVSLDKVTFDEPDYDTSTRAVWQQTIEVTLTDDEFQRRMTKYALAMATYHAKLAEYDANIREYEVALKAYLDHKRQVNEERERALLVELQGKWGKT